ncbi:hypothetical protein HDE_09543 [Halotydeus destructor]|nr:hypothetical protein HDE_09543 [Halotydeus destructor]
MSTQETHFRHFIGVTILVACHGLYFGSPKNSGKLISLITLLGLMPQIIIIYRTLSHDDRQFNSKRLFYCHQALTGLMHMIVVRMKTRNVVNTFNSLIRKCRKASRHRIKQASYVTLATWMIFNVYPIHLRYVTLTRSNTATSMGEAYNLEGLGLLGDILAMVTDALSNWIDIGALLMAFSSYLSYNSIQNQLTIIAIRSPEVKSRAVALELTRELRKRKLLRRTLAESLSSLPAFWFANFFLSGSFSILLYRKYSDTFLWMHSVPILENVTMVVMVIMFIDRLNEIQMETSITTVDKIMGVSSLTKEHVLLIDELKDMQLRIPAMGLFVVDKFFLLSFTATFVSFSVLFIQIHDAVFH